MPSKAYLIALTGSIGSGKSTVAGIFEKLGAKIIDADMLAREAVMPRSPALAKLREVFGDSIVGDNGVLDRASLASIIFSDPAAREKAEAIIHPQVESLFRARLQAFEPVSNNRGNMPDSLRPVVVYVVPLLYEARLPLADFEKVVVVSAPEERLVERIMARNGYSREEACMRLATQIPMSEKVRRADIVIDNSGSTDELEAAVRSAWGEISAAAVRAEKTKKRAGSHFINGS